MGAKPRVALSLDQRYDMWMGRMEKAGSAVNRCNEAQALRIVERAGEEPGEEPGNVELMHSLRLIKALRGCELGEVVGVCEQAFTQAKSYWNEAGPRRLVAIPAMVLARVVGAERLAESTSREELKRAISFLDEARSVDKSYPNSSVRGISDVRARVQKRLKNAAKTMPREKLQQTVRRPMARKAMATARSFRRGSLNDKDLQAMAELARKPAALLEMAGDMESYDGDAYLWEGDLVVKGDFKTSDIDAIWLVVKGNLIVHGLYEDTCDDGPDFIHVAGNLVADDVITAGALEVSGDLRAAQAIVGDYNDGWARIGGNLVARLFAATDHSFEVGGHIRADHVLQSGHIVGAKRHGISSSSWADVPFAAEFELDDLLGRLRAGKPVLAPVS